MLAAIEEEELEASVVVVALETSLSAVERVVEAISSMPLFTAVAGDKVLLIDSLTMLVVASLATTVATISSETVTLLLTTLRSVVVVVSLTTATVTGAVVVTAGAASVAGRLVDTLTTGAADAGCLMTSALLLMAMAMGAEVKGTGASAVKIGLVVGMRRDGSAVEHRLHLSRETQLPLGQGAATHFQFLESHGTSNPQSSSIRQSAPSL